MRVAIIGRTEVLFDTMLLLMEHGHEIGVIVTSKEAPEYKKTSADFEKFAKDKNIPFFKTAKITEIVQDLRALPPMDIGVSMNYSGIIAGQVIDCFPLGILNAHGGDLPRYRGNACQAWAILNGEERIGLCIHSMIGGELDNGKIIARDYLPITIDTKIGTVWQWMADRTPDLFLQSVDLLAGDPDYVLEVQSTDPKDALRCYPRMPDDGRIDWSKSAENVLRLINASGEPYAGAFTFFGDQKIVIVDSQLAPYENFVAVPGQITEVAGDYVEVACGQGKIRIRSVRVDGDTVHLNQIVKSIRTRFV